MAQFVWKRHKDIFKGVGIYHLTFVVSGRKPLLGRLAIDHDEPRLLPTALGSAISLDISHIQNRRPYVRILAKQLMPDHIHVLLYVTEDMGVSIKEIARGMRQGWKQLAQALTVAEAGTVATVSICPQMTSVGEYEQTTKGEKQQEAEKLLQGEKQQPLFEAPFIRTLAHKGQLQAMIAYIHDNPRRVMLRRQHPDFFSLRRNMQVKGMVFTSVGNLFLLDYPDKQAVICSRSLSESQIAYQQAAALSKAENGCVTVTAAISAGEKQIARAVREADFPLIILLKDGFPDAGDTREKYYKPGGVYFQACAAGQLLLLKPDATTMILPDIQMLTEQALRQKAEARHLNYQPIPANSDRYRMTAINEIIKLLCL